MKDTMTLKPTLLSSRHLIDPEIVDLLDVFPVLNLSAETLPSVREMMGAPVEGAPDPVELFPEVTTTEYFVHGAEGDPDVRVLYYEPKNKTTTPSAAIDRKSVV